MEALTNISNGSINLKISTENLERSKALLSAILENDLEAVKTIISEGGDVNIRYCETCISPVHVAAYMGNDEILKYLLMNGAVADSEDRYGRTPLHFAAYNDKVLCVKLLLGGNVDIDKKTQRTQSGANRNCVICDENIVKRHPYVSINSSSILEF